MLMLKKLTENNSIIISSIEIFERKQTLGSGMPYSKDGALEEHITNVSGNEIPELESSVREWIADRDHTELGVYGLKKGKFNDFKVLPRLLFGSYLGDQFAQLINRARNSGKQIYIHLNTEVADIIDQPQSGLVSVATKDGKVHQFDKVMICSGHLWPKRLEGNFPGCYDAPYPPAKIAISAPHQVAIRGSSLTAIDAVRTLARSNGNFAKGNDGKLKYQLDPQSQGFRITMHSRNGLLPAVRLHLADSHLAKDSVLSAEEIATVRDQNNGFVPLDYIYKRNFLDRLEESHPIFHALIKHLPMEKFVRMMMERRENAPAFELLRAEMAEARISIENQEPVYWKEMLAVLSFAMNYPAKYFSAEDMARLRTSLMPLISVVIAFAPQGSVGELLALHEAGLLDIQSVGTESEIEPSPQGGITYHWTDEMGNRTSKRYQTFIDCIGQPHLQIEDLPYKSLVEKGTVAPARLRYLDQQRAMENYRNDPTGMLNQNGLIFERVPGIAINDSFQVVCPGGSASERIYMLAVPFIGGYNPDYSGLDFSEAASTKVAAAVFQKA